MNKNLKPILFDEEIAKFVAIKFHLSPSWVKMARRRGYIPRKYMVDNLHPIPDEWMPVQEAVLDLLDQQPCLSVLALGKLYATYDSKLSDLLKSKRSASLGLPVTGKVTRLYREELSDIVDHLLSLRYEIGILLNQIHQLGPGSETVQKNLARIGENPVLSLAAWLGLTNAEKVGFSLRKPPGPTPSGRKSSVGPRVLAPIANPVTLAKFRPAIHHLWSALCDLPELTEPEKKKLIY